MPNPETTGNAGDARNAPEGRAQSDRWRVLTPVLLALATLLVYGSVCGFGFVNYDDDRLITGNIHYNPAVTGAGVAYLWAHPYQHMYTPGIYTLWGLCALFRLPAPVPIHGAGMTDMNAAVFHAVGLALHIGNALLIYALVQRLLRTRLSANPIPARVGAAAGALLFSLHPVQTECVGWVDGSHPMAAALLSLAAIWFYVRHVDYRQAGNGRAARNHYLVATLVFVLALLTKPTAAAAPIIATVLEATLLRRGVREWLPTISVWLLLAFVCFKVTNESTADSLHFAYPLWSRPFVVGDSLAFYLVKLAWPVGLSMDYGRSLPRVLHGWFLLVDWILPVALAIAGWWFWRARHGDTLSRAVAAGGGLLVAGALPTLGLAPFYFQPISTVADRYLYLAMLGPALLLGALVARGVPKRARLVTVGILLALCAIRTAAQLPVWHDSEVLYRHTLAVNPRSELAYYNLGNVYTEEGRYPEAADILRADLRLEPANSRAWHNLGLALSNQNEYKGAASAFAEYARLKPQDDDAQFLTGIADLASGDRAGARAHLQRCLALNPKHPHAPEVLAQALRQPLGK